MFKRKTHEIKSAHAISLETMHRQDYPVIKSHGTDLAIYPLCVPEDWDFRTKTRVEPYELVEMAIQLCNGVSETERERQISLIKEAVAGIGG